MLDAGLIIVAFGLGSLLAWYGRGAYDKRRTGRLRRGRYYWT